MALSNQQVTRDFGDLKHISQLCSFGHRMTVSTLALLVSVTNLPIIYMEVVDGHAFDWNGINGALLIDAALSGAACIILAILLRRQLVRPMLGNALE
jgi:hypothetical protein